MKEKLFEELRKFLTEEEIQKVLSHMGTDIKVKVTSDPKEFEEKTRRLSDELSHSWAGASETRIDTEVLVGDYAPGLHSEYVYSENGNMGEPVVEDEMADFTLSGVQIAKVRHSYESTFSSDMDSDYDYTEIVIYIPDEKAQETYETFKEMIKKERREALIKKIKEKVGDKVPDDVIEQIVDRYDLLIGKEPEVIVTSDPKSFDERSRKDESDVSHSWAGRDLYTKEPVVVLGDYQSGESKVYEYYKNGTLTVQEKSDTLSDFSMDKPQIVLTYAEYDYSLSEPSSEGIDNAIVIYLPDLKKVAHKKVSSFKEMIKRERRFAFIGKVMKMTSGRLTYNQLMAIVDSYDFEFIESPEIIVTSNPEEFESQSRTYHKEIGHSWAGKDERSRDTKVVVGDFEPGYSEEEEYYDNGTLTYDDKVDTPSDFALYEYQVALTTERVDDTLSDLEEHSKKHTVVIYIPNSETLPLVDRYSEMVELLRENPDDIFCISAFLGLDELATPELVAGVQADLVEMAEEEKRIPDDNDEQEQ